MANVLLDKETLDLRTIIDVLGERPFAPKSNFKAYLESKKTQEVKPVVEQEINPKNVESETKASA